MSKLKLIVAGFVSVALLVGGLFVAGPSTALYRSQDKDTGVGFGPIADPIAQVHTFQGAKAGPFGFKTQKGKRLITATADCSFKDPRTVNTEMIVLLKIVDKNTPGGMKQVAKNRTTKSTKKPFSQTLKVNWTGPKNDQENRIFNESDMVVETLCYAEYKGGPGPDKTPNRITQITSDPYDVTKIISRCRMGNPKYLQCVIPKCKGDQTHNGNKTQCLPPKCEEDQELNDNKTKCEPLPPPPPPPVEPTPTEPTPEPGPTEPTPPTPPTPEPEPTPTESDPSIPTLIEITNT